MSKLTTDIGLMKTTILNWEHKVETGINNTGCVLCRQYYNSGMTDCEGCPIAEYTGKKGCNGTPFYNVPDEDHPDFKRYCEEEVQFLKEVLTSLEDQQ